MGPPARAALCARPSASSSPSAPRPPSGEPVADADFKAELVSPDGTRRPLPLVRQEDQVLGSVNDTQTAGDYAIEVTAEREGQAAGLGPGTGSSSSARTSSSTTPRPTPTR